MTDTERLDLIEHYGWVIDTLKNGKGWCVTGRLSIFHVARETLREAIDAAIAAQCGTVLR